MKLNSKSFLLSALLVLGLVAGSSAAGVFGFKNADEIVSRNLGDDEFSDYFDYVTKVIVIGQFDRQEEAVEKGYAIENLYDTWSGSDGFRNHLNETIYDAMNDCDVDFCEGFKIQFETDIDLGGFEVSGGDTLCVNAFDPILIPVGISMGADPEILGNGKTIKGYCDIGQGDKSFFRGVENFGRNNESFVALQSIFFSDLHFDSAYVKASGYETRAAVFADTANTIYISNVSVTNSTISSSFTAGGLVACYETGFENMSSVHVNATLRGRIVGGLFGHAHFSNPDAYSSVSGASVNVEVYAAGEDSVLAGGIAGKIPTMRNPGFTFSDDTVTLVIPNGVDTVLVGGLVGKFFYFPSQSAEFQNLNNTIDLFVNSTGYSTYAGGLAGYGSMSNVSITDSLNNIHAVIATKGTRPTGGGQDEEYEDGVSVGGEFGFIQNVAGLRVVHDAIDARLVAAGTETQFLGGVAGAMMAAQGYTVSFAQNDVKVSVASSGEGKINVAMGGLLGMATVLNQQGGDVDIVCDTNTVTASMQAASTGGVYAGGLAGIVMDESGVGMGGFYSDESVIKAPEGSNLITMSSNTMEDLFMGGLVGRMDIPHFLIKTRRTNIGGNIVASATTYEDASAVGGLFGEFTASRAYVYDNLSEGDILASVENIGFVVGNVLSSVSDDEGIRITSNVHVGSKDVNAKQVLGAMTLAENPITNWNEGTGSIQDFNYSVVHNYRNAIASETTPLESTGGLDIDGSGYINAKVPYQGQAPDEILYRDAKLLDGILDESTMKSRLLTYVLTQKENRAPNGVDDIESDYTCWDNDSTGVLYVCRNQDDRTVYKVQVDISSIYPKLREGERDSLADILIVSPVLMNDEPTGDTSYSLIAYTENDSRLSEGFVKRAKALSVDYGVVDEYGTAQNLETLQVWSNQGYYGLENFDIEIVYEIAEPNVEPINYVSLEEALPDAIYLWPKITKVRRYGTSGTVPSVFTMSGNTNQEYYLQIAYAECPDVAPEGDPEEEPECETAQPYTADELGPITFDKVVNRLVRNGAWPYQKTIHLIYKASTEEQKTPEMTVGGDGNRSVLLTGYGYRDTSVVLFDSSYVGGSGLAILPIASKYTAKPSVGFTLDKWKVDFWVISNGESGFNIENCYDTTAVSEACASIASFTSAENYFGRTDDIYNAILEHAGERENMRWSAELDSDGVLVMDSIISAFSGFTGSDFTFTYHMHVAPVMTPIPYTITFNVNVADSVPVFISGYTDTLVIYSMESYENRELPQLNSAKACFAGWGEKATEPLYGAIDLDENILGAVVPENGSFSLYARWMTSDVTGSNKPTVEGEDDACSNRPVQKVPLEYLDEAGSEQGSVYLWQKLVNVDDTLKFRHNFENDTLEIPEDSYNLWFHVGADPKPGYVLAKVLLLTDELETEWTDSTWLNILSGEDLIVLNPSVAAHRLYAKFEKYIPVSFDLVTGREDVFYDDRFERGDTMKVIIGGGDLDLPYWIYTADSCVLGWSVEATMDSPEFYSFAESDVLYERVQESQKLYAVWGDAARCVENGYVRLSAKAEYGKIELVEENDSGNRVHALGKDGETLLPEERGGMFVRVEPDDGYMLDRIELIQDGETIILENGDWLENIMDGAELVAYFVEYEKPVGDSTTLVLEWAGNAIRFTYINKDFANGHEPWVYVTLENVDGDKVADTLFCNTHGCDIEWEKFPLSRGYYLFTASTRDLDGRDTILLERDFEVKSAIQVAGEKSWQMLSLASVDLDELSWDGDEIFYWWAEDRNYGKYWQYQEFTKGQTPEPERGYWYSSIEGRPLQLKDYAYTDDVTWNLTNVNGGWNMVANPYGWYLNLGLSDEEALDEEWLEEEKRNREDVDEEWLEREHEMHKPSVEFSRWNAEEGQYVPVKTLKPYEAVWAKLNREEGETWEFSAKPHYVGTVSADGNVVMNKSLNRRLAKVGGKNGWSLRVTLSDGKGKKDSWNMLGAGAVAWQSEEPPAGMGDRVNLSILGGGKRLTKSVKTTGDSYEWPVELFAASNRTGYLEVSDMESLQERGLRVFLTVDGKTVEMRSGEKIPVALSATAKIAQIRVAPSAKQVVAGSLQGVRAVQSGRSMDVSFEVSENLAGSRTVVEIVNMEGKVVANRQISAISGMNLVALDAPKPGLYMLRVRAGSQMKAGRILVR